MHIGNVRKRTHTRIRARRFSYTQTCPMNRKCSLWRLGWVVVFSERIKHWQPAGKVRKQSEVFDASRELLVFKV